MALEVKLEVFEGPLDLLLHLIEKNKVDIYDIPIVEITEQYLDYIRQMQTEDMNVMSEFLLMAATLLDIKCRMLLPREINEEGEEEDPRAELVEKLLEYKMYKYMSFELRDMELDATKSFYREKDVPREVEAYRPPLDYNELLKDMTLAKLQEIFEGILKRQEDKKDPVRSNFGRIEKDEVSVDQKAVYVEDFIRIMLVLNEKRENEIINIGGGEEYPIRTFIKIQVAPIRNTVIRVIRHCKDSFFTIPLPP